MTALWREAELTAAFGAAPSAPMSEAAGGVSIDSRTLSAGDLFFAIKGETHDGHDHVARAFDFGAAAAVISRERAGRLADLGARFRGRGHAEGHGAAGRRRSRAGAGAHRRGDRFGRQDDREGDAARDARRLRRDPRLAGFLQQSLGRAADACAHGPERQLRRVRNRHESRGRNLRRSRAWCGRTWPW